MDMKFCRRCSQAFTSSNKHVFTCPNGHAIYANAAPTVGIILANNKGEIVILERAIDPGKGLCDLPGGFCDGAETLEAALEREIEEEIGLTRDQYSKPVFISSGIDPYEFSGETVPALASVFYAEITDPDAILIASDDAAAFSFRPTSHELADTLFFPSLQYAVHELVNNGVPQYTKQS